jgi:hypothetical protein
MLLESVIAQLANERVVVTLSEFCQLCLDPDFAAEFDTDTKLNLVTTGLTGRFRGVPVYVSDFEGD